MACPGRKSPPYRRLILPSQTNWPPALSEPPRERSQNGIPKVESRLRGVDGRRGQSPPRLFLLTSDYAITNLDGAEETFLE
jgi:hypothetical protein